MPMPCGAGRVCLCVACLEYETAQTFIGTDSIYLSVAAKVSQGSQPNSGEQSTYSLVTFQVKREARNIKTDLSLNILNVGFVWTNQNVLTTMV